MFACVNTGLNIVDVEDVAKGHILAWKRGAPARAIYWVIKNLTFTENNAYPGEDYRHQSPPL